jgi:ankyrin repeat protein
LAAKNGHRECAELLLGGGARPDGNSQKRPPLFETPLYDAAVGGHDGVVEALLRYGADPDGLMKVQSSAGGFYLWDFCEETSRLYPDTPYFAAKRRKHHRVAEMLKAHKAAICYE